ncbi:MAG TPA: aminotransferase class I/II-fold pyridoxal phosphate-dependent enzyme [Aliicoccus persicus]|uniref:cysteine-S-conjugate beta-lyase n=1 Tax=Aliicoccus persicus TaxID=930138 RepID=A0A921DXR7_9STAP|nr:aminotransferase class I/II-fold pyridoxal phosphate-dependent enzyme [Aliicoccus persicus]
MIDFDKVTSRLGTDCVKFDGTSMLFNKEGLAPFWVADMDFEIPDGVHQSIQNRLDARIFGYTMLSDANFYAPIQHWWKERFNIDLDGYYIGSSPTVLFVIREYMERYSDVGDSILITSPSYNGFLNLIENNNRNRLECPLSKTENGFELDFDQFESLCKDEKTKIYVHCNPHNPTGKVWTADENKKIYDICKRNNVQLISDEIHMDFVRNVDFSSMFKQFDKNDPFIVVSGLGKTFNLASLPFGYYLTKHKALKESYDQRIKKELNIITENSLTLAALQGAYYDSAEWVDALNAYIEDNMKLVKSFIDEHLSETLSFEVPNSTYLAWISFEQVGFTGEDVQKALIEVGNVAISPGHIYGESSDQWIRLNVATRRDYLLEGLEALKKSFEHLKEITSP